MKYIAQKHEEGLAIITWCIDEHYELCSNHMYHAPDGIYYMMFVDIYDSSGNLINETGIGGIDIQYPVGTDKFKEEIINSYEFYFTPSLKV